MAEQTKPFVEPHLGPTPDELIIEDLIVGTGDEAGRGTRATVHYVGVAHSTGEQFDASWDRDETFASGALTMTGAQAGASEGGAVLTLHYLTDDAVAEFRSTQSPATCPAPFFNRYARQRILIPATPEVERQLRAIELPDFRQVASWRPFALRGYCVRSAPVIQKDGQPAAMPTNMFDNCLTMVATRLDVRNQPVIAASQRP